MRDALEQLRHVEDVILFRDGWQVWIGLDDGTEIRAAGVDTQSKADQLIDFVDVYVNNGIWDKKLNFSLRIE